MPAGERISVGRRPAGARIMGTMHIFVETERLILRRFTEADVDDLVELDSDPEVMRFITGGEPTARDTVANDILPRLLSDYRRFVGGSRWAAVEKDTGQFIGWFALRPRNGIASERELGYRLRRSAWGKGYATEGCRALVDTAFTDLGANLVYGDTMAVNTTSRRVMEKVGLKLARTYHATWENPIAGTEHGEVVYELHSSDWLPDTRTSDGEI
jgi:RimJ/RimL family protein N-acetyltransferase